MDKTLLIIVSLTSAAIGALVSNLIGLLGQWLERRARRKELLLQEALRLADWRIEILKHNADKTNEDIEMEDKIIQTERYYKLLKHLMKKGKLPADFATHGKFPD